jgi:hypothetical protein
MRELPSSQQTGVDLQTQKKRFHFGMGFVISLAANQKISAAFNERNLDRK